MSDDTEHSGAGGEVRYGRRRHWSEAQKRRIVAESYQPGGFGFPWWRAGMT